MTTSVTTVDAATLAVRRTTPADHAALVHTLTAAFLDDPVFSWWVPERQRRTELLPPFFEIVLDWHQPYDELWATEPIPAATAVWAPPGCQPAEVEMERLVGRFVAAAEETADRLTAVFQLMDECHPHEPHAYLFFLATQPGWQGRGLGSRLMRAVLDRCDRDGSPAYLEATCPDNVRLYRRHGFEVVGEIPLPDGPSLTPMWRQPVSG